MIWLSGVVTPCSKVVLSGLTIASALVLKFWAIIGNAKAANNRIRDNFFISLNFN